MAVRHMDEQPDRFVPTMALMLSYGPAFKRSDQLDASMSAAFAAIRPTVEAGCGRLVREGVGEADRLWLCLCGCGVSCWFGWMLMRKGALRASFEEIEKGLCYAEALRRPDGTLDGDVEEWRERLAAMREHVSDLLENGEEDPGEGIPGAR